MQFYCADFETVNNREDCRVWAWGLENLYSDEYADGGEIETFIQHITKDKKNKKIWFHNLKFDGEFILQYLIRHKYKYNETPKYNGEYNTLISDMGVFYSISFKHNNCKIDIYDSLKLLPFKLKDIAKQLKLDVQKLTIDYNEIRTTGHIATKQEKQYLYHDVHILKLALCVIFEYGIKKITIGSNALSDYKETIGKTNFKKLFPPPKYDKDIRQAYKGGFVYVNPIFAGKTLGEGIVLDINSLYPYVLRDCLLPYGEPLFFEGKYEKDDYYPLYVQMFRCNFDLKEGYLPTIQLKNSPRFTATEYVKTTNGEPTTLCLSSVDLELFFEHYNVSDIEWFSGYKFRASTDLFKEYIDKWFDLKIKAEKDGNLGLRLISKLMQNNLYGKFATNPDAKEKIPVGLKEDGTIAYSVQDSKREPVYIPVGIFVTAYARRIIITAAQKNYCRFIYCDTDSLHLIGIKLPLNLKIDKYLLGYFKHEATFTKAKYLRPKTYIETINGELKVTCCGMPENIYPQVTYDNFCIGSAYKGKLRPVHVSNGIVLEETNFSLR